MPKVKPQKKEDCDKINKSYTVGKNPESITRRHKACLDLPHCQFNDEKRECYYELRNESSKEPSISKPKPPMSPSSFTTVSLLSSAPVPVSIRPEQIKVIKEKSNDLLDLFTHHGFQLLTFNNITKYYGNAIIMTANGRISHYQWHRFQLLKMAQILNLPTTDKLTGSDLASELLGNAIKISNSKNVGSSPDALKYGLVAKKTTNPLYHLDNIGGQPHTPLFLNKYQNMLVFTRDNYYHYLSDTDVVPKIPQVIKKPSQDKTDAQDLAECRRSQIELLKGSNKCYMDSVLQILLVNTPENILGQHLKQIFTRLTQDKQTPAYLTNLAKQINRIDHDLKLGKSTNLRGFINGLSSFPANIKEKLKVNRFITRTPEDPIDFLSFFLEVFGVDFTGYNENLEYFCQQKYQLSRQVKSYAENLEELTDLRGIFNCDPPKIARHRQSDAIYLTNPSINIVDLQVNDGTGISNMLAWQDETVFSDAKPPFYQITTEPGWEFTQVSGEGGVKEGIFKKSSSERLKLSSFTKEPPAKQYVVDWSNKKFIYRGNTIATFGYRYRINSYAITQAKFLVFCLDRINLSSQEIALTRIIPEENIQLGTKILKLTGVICYQEGGIGHYLGYYLCQDNWYRYNDMAPKIRHVGIYDDLIGQEMDWVVKRGIMFIYCAT